MSKKFKHYRQLNMMDCGATCIRMIAKHYGKNISIKKLHEFTDTTRVGVNMPMLAEAADKIGFRTIGVKIDAVTFFNEVPLPCITYWNKDHFVVVYKVTKHSIYVANPASTTIRYSKKEFIQHWIGIDANEKTKEGLALIFQPTPRLHETEEDIEDNKQNFRYLFKYLFVHKKFLAQLVIGVITGSVISLILPFLTQSIVDIGIRNQNINFIYLVLLAQISLFIGKISIEIIRGWILLHLSTRISISLISDFFIKLMNLPIYFFDTKQTGDILERVSDHKRIENLLTNSPLSALLAIINIVVFGSILAYYSLTIFGVFFIGSILYFLWILLFFKKRKIIDTRHFYLMSHENEKIIELINGMQEIKLHNAERVKRWGWEFIKVKLFKVAIKRLSLEQLINIGTSLINELKNIIVVFVSAKLVIQGDITLGMMLSIMYIIGQLNGPLQEMLKNSYSVQDAKIALERLYEIHKQQDEININQEKIDVTDINHDLQIENLSFTYPGKKEPVLKNINLTIPTNKTTAIVGVSGSGKTTLIKLLLKFYNPKTGRILLKEQSLDHISQNSWRDKCGVVMQDGYIFNDTIAKNIAIGQQDIDKKKLAQAVEIANIKKFIEQLPQTYNTKIGNDGVGLSGGEKQRILIARAVYKNPDLMFFDEATSALDTNNERVIVKNLNLFFQNKTVVIIAHRLSTVKNADQIIVLDKGEVAEIGNHEQLTKMRGKYYNLVKNQLELGV
ncbi:peptidase domain-containing ABC transporter [Aquimarina algiphila]|uniref:Peptidase domain-containing ABC transporter n=1 Tax=Aquimarina algiphila TaxID=2047982 RepID=A0A554VN00_9FLAO|nr:peptidase domain-containing ABC transporter [Aquimarina algiphila]TSE09739.1 peptidase domain-containing ABC transporter [Aquimarina algiphila]